MGATDNEALSGVTKMDLGRVTSSREETKIT